MKQYEVQNRNPELTVNEQNPQAIGFYAHMGFEIYKRSDTDEESNPYPLLYMKLIGVVSDRRNQDGVPYVIHHNSPHQKSYEEDILEKRNDLVGHYRISE